jgi:hypothetical protein
MIMNEFMAKKNAGQGDLNLPILHKRMDIHFIKSKLRYAVAALSALMIWDEKIEIGLISEVEIAAQRPEFQEVTEIFVFLQLYYMLSKFVANDPEAMEHFEILMKVMLDGTHGMGQIEIYETCQSMTNFCFTKLRRGEKRLSAEIKDLINIQLKTDVLLESGMLQQRFYKSIASSMLRLGEIEWTRDFVEHWKNRIFGDSEQLCYYHNLASVLLATKEYPKVIEVLYNRLSKYEDELYSLSARVYICRCLWEMEEFDWLASNLKAFQKYLLRNEKLSEAGRHGHQLFVSFFIKLYDAKMATPEKRIRKIGMLISKISQHGGRDRFLWLSKKIEEELSKCTN